MAEPSRGGRSQEIRVRVVSIKLLKIIPLWLLNFPPQEIWCALKSPQRIEVDFHWEILRLFGDVGSLQSIDAHRHLLPMPQNPEHLFCTVDNLKTFVWRLQTFSEGVCTQKDMVACGQNLDNEDCMLTVMSGHRGERRCIDSLSLPPKVTGSALDFDGHRNSPGSLIGAP
ncbi:hypothetical protein TNIN_349331 [Trichonephila inaurata madagascariensis]|uniref:Uncharacterized protein n=1 Tax=Trichonephila inaurata madagascariensis TaxID=2747483 RepID=A0A8X6XAI7_9ARAC|nr:hypothetical protein TNIN_349331 [Trichonephila inaurata madagascariensis]